MRRQPAGAVGSQSVIQVQPPTGNSAIDNAAIKAAIALCPTGGVVQLQVGTYAIIDGTTTTSLAISKQITLLGRGGIGFGFASLPTITQSYGTRLTVDHATAVGLSVSGHGVHIDKLYIQNIHSPAPTAGAGIQTITGGGNYTHYGTDLAVRGFYNNVDHQAGGLWLMDTGFFSCDWVNAGVKIQNVDSTDGGDFVLSGNFYAGPSNNGASAISWLTGGGAKIHNIKINTFSSASLTVGILMELQDGVGTSDFGVVNASIEGVQYGFLCEHAGPSNTGTFNHILITGCQFFNIPAASQGVAIAPAATSKVGRVNISGCVFRNNGSGTTYGINFVKVDNASHGPNIFSGYSSDYHDGGSNTNITSVGNG